MTILTNYQLQKPLERLVPPAAIDIKGTNDPNDNYFASKNFQVTYGVHIPVESKQSVVFVKTLFYR